MQNLLDYLTANKEDLNLSSISRKAGFDSQYLKHVVAGRRNLTEESAEKIQQALESVREGDA